MYIHRIILQPLKDRTNIPDLNVTLFNEWTQEPVRSILVSGVNGSGKTTLLRIIAALWENFYNWLRLEKSLNVEQQAQDGILRTVALAAIEIRELVPGVNVWLYTASTPDIRKELTNFAQPDDYFIGETLKGDMGRGRATFEPDHKTTWMETLWTQVEQATVGMVNASSTLPNMIYLEAETRQIVPLGLREKPSVYAEPLYKWLVTYKASDRWNGHIESMLANQKVRDPRKFKTIIDAINEFFAGGRKRLTDFDDNLRLKVNIGQGKRNYHNIDDLSSGERQSLLLMVIISRWLMPGGIVLIDEPDLHMHVSLQRDVIRSIESYISSQQGQLIIASHSPEIWQEFKDPTQNINLNELVEVVNG